MSSVSEHGSIGDGHEQRHRNVRVSDGLLNSESDHDDDDHDDETVSASILDGIDDEDDDVDDEDINLGLTDIQHLREENEHLQEALGIYETEINTLRRRTTTLNEEVSALKNEVDRLKNGNHAPERWYKTLREWFNGQRLDKRYIDIYKDCCKQEDMSQVVSTTHPDLTIVEKELTIEELRRCNSPQRGRRPGPPEAGGFSGQAFAFEALPMNIQARIFRSLLVKGKLIHCISRLDPVNPPVDFPPEGSQENLLLHRFHYRPEPCHIPRAKQPRQLLDILLVSKRWYFIGVHIFYGSNTFAFSSLGELGLFCTGIGRARAERIVNIELMWHGSLMPRASRIDEKYGLPVETRKVSQRTVPLTWLMKTKRLRTLVVHIEEHVERRMRRAYEMQDEEDYFRDFADEDQYDDEELDIFQRMVRRTDFQPNYRKCRSMRTVHGMDYLYQLRGMKWARFYEYERGGPRKLIRDWSFIKDLCSVITLPKHERSIFYSQIENLTPLTCLENWQPSDEDLQLVKRFYDDVTIDDLGDLDDTSDSESFISDESDNHDGDEGNDGDPGPRPPSVAPHSNNGREANLSDDNDESSNANDIMDMDISQDDGQEISDVDSTSTASSTPAPSNLSSSDQDDDDDGNDPPNTTQQTSIPSQLPMVALTLHDDDGEDEKDPSPEISDAASSGSGLFVPWGSVSGGATSESLFVASGSGSGGGGGTARTTEVPDNDNHAADTDDSSSSSSSVKAESEASGPKKNPRKRSSSSSRSSGEEEEEEEGESDASSSSSSSSSPKRPRYDDDYYVHSDPGPENERLSDAGNWGSQSV
ncbi:hypothetical protein F4809DRAFT_660039 [Biscogniauxia mediterranea]|nr:hypothetical protein F4809DRAFT_660039 [Biscogniauxia mediterranea]